MNNDTTPRHLRVTEPSPWVERFADLVPAHGHVLDVAAGGGRHARLFAAKGYRVTAVDKSIEALADFDGEVIEADLENGGPWPLGGQKFAGIVVVNYLFRPLFPRILEALAPGGVLIYETFARGNEAYAKPRNPDHLLKAGELLDLAHDHLQVVAYEHGLVKNGDLPGVKQRLCATNDLHVSSRDDFEPNPHKLT